MTHIRRTRIPPVVEESVRGRILSRRGAATAVTSVVSRTRGESPIAVARTGELHSLADADQFVIDLLKVARPPMNHFREGKYTHVSDIISKCARKIALVRRLGVRHAPTKLLDGHAITFAQGDAIHHFIKKRFTQGHPDKVWARWGCACGATLTLPMLLSQVGPRDTCKVCGKVPDRYVELALEDDDHEVVGSPDLILYLNDLPAFYPVEVKSMAKDPWEALERPVPDHVIQALFYWNLMHRRGYSMVDQTSVLYVKKEYTWKLPYKEFIIRPSEQLHRLESFVEELEAIKNARDPKAPLPPRVVCGTRDAPEAKQCPVCVSCFQLPAR
jgi:hypothetical protein